MARIICAFAYRFLETVVGRCDAIYGLHMIDPIILLTEELRLADQAIRRVARRERAQPADAEVINTYFRQMEKLRGEILRVVPTSAVGAAELLRAVMPQLQKSFPLHADHIESIAARLADGQRLHSDFVWLRELHANLSKASLNPLRITLATFIHSALIGACRPVLIYRAVNSPRTSGQLKSKYVASNPS